MKVNNCGPAWINKHTLNTMLEEDTEVQSHPYLTFTWTPEQKKKKNKGFNQNLEANSQSIATYRSEKITRSLIDRNNFFLNKTHHKTAQKTNVWKMNTKISFTVTFTHRESVFLKRVTAFTCKINSTIIYVFFLIHIWMYIYY